MSGESLRERVLFQIQKGIPLVERPFAELAAACETDEDTFLAVVKECQTEKLIRRISPIFDTRIMGYDSALVAFQIAAPQIEAAAALVSAHPGVSHNYERQHKFNLWFTLATPPDSALGVERTVAILAHQTRAEDFAILRSVKTYKIGVKLSMQGHGLRREQVSHQEKEPVSLQPAEQKIICLTQQPLALVPRPFAVYAQQLEIPEAEVISTLRTFQQRGILRRIAGILFHRRAGFRANGMSVWNAPAEQADQAGQTMASFAAVSHCYLRTTTPNWPYNIFAMIHGKTSAEVEQVVDAIRQETGLNDSFILYSTREFKKKRIQYFSQELHDWENAQGMHNPPN